MKRPKLEDFYSNGKTYCVQDLIPIYVNYFEALGNYCDELEKALDKTCSKLEEINVCPHMTEKEWRKWSLENE